MSRRSFIWSPLDALNLQSDVISSMAIPSLLAADEASGASERPGTSHLEDGQHAQGDFICKHF